MLVGEGEELVEGGVCEDVVGGDGGVVDFGYVDEVVDCEVFVSKMWPVERYWSATYRRRRS